jgi:hypothetical protein
MPALPLRCYRCYSVCMYYIAQQEHDKAMSLPCKILNDPRRPDCSGEGANRFQAGLCTVQKHLVMEDVHALPYALQSRRRDGSLRICRVNPGCANLVLRSYLVD